MHSSVATFPAWSCPLTQTFITSAAVKEPMDAVTFSVVSSNAPSEALILTGPPVSIWYWADAIGEASVATLSIVAVTVMAVFNGDGLGVASKSFTVGGVLSIWTGPKKVVEPLPAISVHAPGTAEVVPSVVTITGF